MLVLIFPSCDAPLKKNHVSWTRDYLVRLAFFVDEETEAES